MKMHERYLFPALALLSTMVLVDWRWRLLYAVVSVTFFLNLYYVLPLPDPDCWCTQTWPDAVPLPLQLVVTAANVGAYLWLSWQIVGGAPSLSRGHARHNLSPSQLEL
jgi:hypothetical protein